MLILIQGLILKSEKAKQNFFLYLKIHFDKYEEKNLNFPRKVSVLSFKKLKENSFLLS